MRRATWRVSADRPGLLAGDEVGDLQPARNDEQVADIGLAVLGERSARFQPLLRDSDLNLAFQYADKVLLLRKGKMQAFGTPMEVLTEENLSYSYDFPMTIHYSESFEYPIILPAVTKDVLQLK